MKEQRENITRKDEPTVSSGYLNIFESSSVGLFKHAQSSRYKHSIRLSYNKNRALERGLFQEEKPEDGVCFATEVWDVT